MQGENAGVTLFETTDGRTELLVIDYTPYDNDTHTVNEAVIRLNMPGVVDVKSDKQLFLGRKNGEIREICLGMKPHESAFLELCFNP